MDAEDRQRLQQWVADKWKHGKCPVCGVDTWQAGQEIFEVRPYTGGNLVLGAGGVFPIVPIICTNCGYSLFVNALISGVVQVPKPPAETQAESSADEPSQQSGEDAET